MKITQKQLNMLKSILRLDLISTVLKVE